MTEREKLINQINQTMFKDTDKGCVKPSEIADFILADRKRVVEPLIEWKECYPATAAGKADFNDAIDETLKLSGVE